MESDSGGRCVQTYIVRRRQDKLTSGIIFTDITKLVHPLPILHDDVRQLVPFDIWHVSNGPGKNDNVAEDKESVADTHYQGHKTWWY